MRWMIGIDLRDLSGGAVAFARWIASRSAEHRFFGTHVVEALPEPALAVMDDRFREAGVQQAADNALAPLLGDPMFTELCALQATSAEDGLEAAASEHTCDAYVIGRRKPRDGAALVRLGRVARRMLRTLSRTTVVVPPDLRETDIPDGPILLGTDLGEASNAAAGVAQWLARDLGTDILVSHVMRVPDQYEAYWPGDDWAAVEAAIGHRAREGLDHWIAERALGDVRSSIVEGDPAAKLVEVAQVSSACMIVVGSRGLAMLDRMFLSSVGSELAASAPIPVVVVPHA